MHVLPVGGTNLQGESHCLCSHKAPGCVDNDSVEGMISPVYIPSLGSLDVGLNWREELEHRNIEVPLLNLRIFRQEQVVGRIRVKQVAGG